MNVPAHIKRRSHEDRLERFVTDCQHILIKRKAERVLEAKEQALRTILNHERNQLP